MPDEKKMGRPGRIPTRAKTHLHQPVVAPETATVAATALPANAPEGALPSEVRPEIVTYEKLVEAIKASGKAYNMEMIDKAYNMANDAHKGVCRRSGEPYICHPLAVARLLLDLGMDTESIAAALLHDVVEDTPTTMEEIKAAFGEEVALLVDGVTKLTKMPVLHHGGAAGREPAQDAAGHEPGCPGHASSSWPTGCTICAPATPGPSRSAGIRPGRRMEVYAPMANRLGIRT